MIVSKSIVLCFVGAIHSPSLTSSGGQVESPVFVFDRTVL